MKYKRGRRLVLLRVVIRNSGYSNCHVDTVEDEAIVT